jgi:hypothetical protein
MALRFCQTLKDFSLNISSLDLAKLHNSSFYSKTTAQILTKSINFTLGLRYSTLQVKEMCRA